MLEQTVMRPQQNIGKTRQLLETFPRAPTDKQQNGSLEPVTFLPFTPGLTRKGKRRRKRELKSVFATAAARSL